MKRVKYVLNKHTLQYEKHTESVRMILLKVFGLISAIIVASFALVSITHNLFPSPKEKALQRELQQMEYQYASLVDQVNKMTTVLDNIQSRDANVHRVLFGMDPIDQSVWEGGSGGHDRYANLTRFANSSDILISAKTQVERLERQMYLQSKSLDTIQKMAMEREKMMASIPSIKPVREDRLKKKMNLLSGFGYRIHPIHKVRKMHQGIDFTAPYGTPIRATGNGKVVRVEQRSSGYGRNVMIDHGFGYKTLYAHMRDIDVKVGDVVVKGQKIGSVGNTGTSTAPHLHYEVHYKSKAVNPIHYCMDGLDPSEYAELVERASIANQSFD